LTKKLSEEVKGHSADNDPSLLRPELCQQVWTRLCSRQKRRTGLLIHPMAAIRKK
jgi:hypothetical protein